ncbi:MAG: chemotaxis protein MotB, partial [Ignavibacteria bacterium]|nr:chemotaxis protein MotB [Ignavibacteria bacterium]
MRNASSKSSVKKVKPVDSEESHFNEDGDKDRYLITYADLITLLLGLFIILYAMSNIDVNKYKGVVSALGNVFGNESSGNGIGSSSNIIPKPSDKLAEDLYRLVEQYNYSNSIRLDENERG